MENDESAPPAWASNILNSMSSNISSLGSLIKANSDLIKKSSADMAASVDQLGKRMDALEQKTNGGFSFIKFHFKNFLHFLHSP